MPYRLLDDFAPLLVVQRDGVADAASVGSMLAWVKQHLDTTPDKVGYVYDAGRSTGGIPDAAARKVGADWLRLNERLVRKRAAGLDFAFASPLSRGALTAVFWIAPPPVPSTIHATLEAAVTAALARIGNPHSPREVVRALTR